MNETTNDYGEKGKVRFLRAESFQRQLPRRKFPFRFKITDIEGGELLQPEPAAKLVQDLPVQDQMSFPQRLRRWVGELFGSKLVALHTDDFDNQLNKDYIKRILAKKGIRP